MSADRAGPGVESEEDLARGWLFWSSLVIGVGIMAVAVVGMLDNVWLQDRPLVVARWVIATALVHDLVLAPMVTVAALVVARFLHPPWRGPVSAALVLSALLVGFSYPLLRGFGRRESNPSILPLDYQRNVVVLLVTVWVVAAVVVGVRIVRDRRA
jgi:hypothetical protein